MKEFIAKYYVFTLTYIALMVALVMFKADKDTTNIIIGAMVGLISAPMVLPKE